MVFLPAKDSYTGAISLIIFEGSKVESSSATASEAPEAVDQLCLGTDQGKRAERSLEPGTDEVDEVDPEEDEPVELGLEAAWEEEAVGLESALEEEGVGSSSSLPADAEAVGLAECWTGRLAETTEGEADSPEAETDGEGTAETARDEAGALHERLYRLLELTGLLLAMATRATSIKRAIRALYILAERDSQRVD
jgi:hypothetical protein